jgi:hypothetical protein
MHRQTDCLIGKMTKLSTLSWSQQRETENDTECSSSSSSNNKNKKNNNKVKSKVKLSPNRPIGLRDVNDPTLSRQ